MKLNVLVKRNEECPFKISLCTAIATNLSKSKFERIKALNTNLLGDYDFIAYADTDCTWWDSISRYLTKNKLYSNQVFVIDRYGDIQRYKGGV